MKKIVFILSVLISSTCIAQIGVNGAPSNSVTNSNVFLDASSSFSSEAGAGANVGKGFIVPSVDLVNFEFDLALADGFTFPTYFDGMVVYNNATGTTVITGDRSSTATAVTPGFYYFSNPNGATNANITGGEWKPLGAGAAATNNVFAVTTATYTTLATDGTLLVNVPTGGATVTLPAASANNGKVLTIKKVDDDTDVLTFNTSVKATASESFTTLNYATTLKIQSDGTNWWLIN
jgi:hypothetical protein